MEVLDYILDGLEAELALERELGVRSFECDRALLVQADATRASRLPVTPAPVTAQPPAPTPIKQSNNPNNSNNPTRPLVFLHDKPLTAAGAEMMGKIVTALGLTAETAPVVIAAPVPKAMKYVVLGRLALRKWFPGKSVGMGQWFVSDKGCDVLMTYSPADILRYTTVTPAVKKLKQDMWNSLKVLTRR